MKTELTTEQSQHLISLGVPKEKASLILPTDSYEMEDISITTGMPIFKLEDFLNGKILPQEIAKGHNIEIDWGSGIWSVNYVNNVSSISQAEELIDALYKLACWYYGEYLKSEENETLDSKR